jgi:hypothetical protein
MKKHSGKVPFASLLDQAKEICPGEEARKWHIICSKIRLKTSFIFLIKCSSLNALD